jgi:hypothetical protein
MADTTEVVTLDAQINAGAQEVDECSTSPSGETSIPVALLSRPKLAQYQTGRQVALVASPSAYVTLSLGNVTRANFLYVSSSAPVLLKLTFVDPAGGSDIVSVIPLAGPLVLEIDSNGPLKSAQVKGTATINWYASGAS